MQTIDPIAALRALDPLDVEELDAWAPAFTVEELMRSPALRSARRSRRAVVAIAGGGLAIGLATTAAAVGVLGSPAPDPVKRHLAALDDGMPADLRYHADVDQARAVAATPSAALYQADLTAGGYCLEVASEGTRPRGATCLTASEVAARQLEVIAPIPDDDAAPLIVGGRANDPTIDAIVARYRDGSSQTIDFGLDRAWLLEVPAAQQQSVLSAGLTIAGLDRDGADVIAVDVPALRDDDPTGSKGETLQSIVVSTLSDGSDLTVVLGVEGRVNVPAAALRLEYPDGGSTAVPLGADGSYRLDLPAERQHSLATRPGSLVATDSRGATVATASVGSVAYWRSRQVTP